MDNQTTKCVMVIDAELPLGLIANTAAVMGITIGKLFPGAVGPDVKDASGCDHLGITEFPVPILQGDRDSLRVLRAKLYEPPYHDLQAVDFSDTAQGCKTYGEYQAKMAALPEAELRYLGIAICGGKKKVNQLTGSLPLLR